MFSYGRFVHEAFDASVLMLLQTCFKSTSGLADVHFSAGAQYFVDNVCLLLHNATLNAIHMLPALHLSIDIRTYVHIHVHDDSNRQIMVESCSSKFL